MKIFQRGGIRPPGLDPATVNAFAQEHIVVVKVCAILHHSSQAIQIE
jgi:hypothetical protein